MNEKNKFNTKKIMTLYFYEPQEMQKVIDYIYMNGFKLGRFAVVAMLEKIRRDSKASGEEDE